MQTSQFVKVIQERQGLKIDAIEEADFKMGFIEVGQWIELSESLLKIGYRNIY